MPNTTNYNWELPTPGGSEGAWGDILNAAFDDIDGEVFAAQNAAAVGSGTPSGTTGSVTLDLDSGRTFVLTPTGPLVVTFANVPSGVVRVEIVLKNPGLFGIAAVSGADVHFHRFDVASSGSFGSSATFKHYVLVTDDGGATWYMTISHPVS